MIYRYCKILYFTLRCSCSGCSSEDRWDTEQRHLAKYKIVEKKQLIQILKTNTLHLKTQERNQINNHSCLSKKQWIIMLVYLIFDHAVLQKFFWGSLILRKRKFTFNFPMKQPSLSINKFVNFETRSIESRVFALVLLIPIQRRISGTEKSFKENFFCRISTTSFRNDDFSTWKLFIY